MKIKFSNLVKMFLAGACFVAVGCSDYSQDIENLNNRVNLLESNKIEPLKTDLEAVKSALESAKTDLQGKIDANEASIEALETALKTAEGDIDTLYDNVAGKVDSEVFEENLTNIMAAIAGLEDTDEMSYEDVYDLFVEEVNNEKARLQAKIEALEAKDAELEALINGINDRLTTTETNLEKAINDLNLLNEAHLALAGEFEQYQADIRDELDKHFAAFKTHTDEALEKFDDLYAKHAEQLILNATLQEKDNELQASINATNEAFELYKEAMVDVVKGLEEQIAENKGAIEVNAQSISKLKDAIADITSRLDQIESKLNELADYVYNKVTEKIDALNGNVDALKNRIQSLVFVPTHTDGKATINRAVLQYEEDEAFTGFWPWQPGGTRPVVKSTFVECQSVLQFQVSPAECALALKDCDPKELNFVLTGALATTRSAEELVPTLEVVKVGLADLKKGIINVFVNARNLGEDFYDVEKGVEYGASLVLKNDLVNIASNYVNLVAASEKNAHVITVEMAEPAQTAYEIEWDSQDHVLVLPDQKFLFNIKGGDTKEEDITIEAMIEKGYNLEVKKMGTKVEPVQIVGGKDIFKNKINTENPHYDYVYVNLDNTDEKQARAAVGSVEKVTYNYNVAGAEFVATSTVEIVKISRTIEMRADNIVWNYHDDALSDTGKVGTKREAAPATITSFPKDVTITYDEIVKHPATVKVFAYGAERNDNPVLVENVSAKFGGTALKPTIELKNFAWGETYKIEAVYDMPDLKIVINATATTVNRETKEIVINLEDAEWMLTEDFEYESETKAESFYEAVYNALVASKVNHAVNNAFDKDSFMKDVFYTNEVVCLDNKANDEPRKSTKLVHVDTYSFKSVYNVDEFRNEVPEKILYEYTMKTWYGQVIKFTKTLNLGLEPVRLELPTEKFLLAKDLVIETKPESVAAIYDMVGKVDKAKIDAATYMKNFFGKTTAETYLVQDGEAFFNDLKETRLSVSEDKENEGNFFATAKFNYADFEKMPEKVTYLTTYTTWYGQKVTIVKDLVIDWYIYDFKAIPEFVYDNGNSFYSQAKAHRVTDKNNMLSDLEISLDLDTAFDVVSLDGEGKRLTKEELKELGLSVKFDFTTKPDAYEGIYFKGNKLYYHGFDKTVGVKGQLILTNSNGVMVPITTKFDVDPKYMGYYVKQYNPVSKFENAKPLTISVPEHAKRFTYYLANQLSLTDDRGFELITPGETVQDTDMALEYKNAAWTIGNGKDNGFAEKANAAEIYGLEYTFFQCDTKNVPAKMIEEKVFTFDAKTGMLEFDNTNDIELTKPIVLDVTVGIRHSWTKEESVSFKVLLQPETAPVEK